MTALALQMVDECSIGFFSMFGDCYFFSSNLSFIKNAEHKEYEFAAWSVLSNSKKAHRVRSMSCDERA